MHNTAAEISDLQIVIHNDGETPWEFVVDLVRSVFGRSETEAKAFTATVAQLGKAVCGVYPLAVADAKAREKDVDARDEHGHDDGKALPFRRNPL